MRVKACTGKIVYLKKGFAMLTKNKVKELIDHMPDTFSVDDLVGEIILLQKIEIARKQVQNGEFLTEEELDTEVDKWD
ncbi:hypothetical protein ACVW0P_000321 [Mucilaginibacter sp. UYNi724]